MDPHFLEFGTSWRRVGSFTSRPVYLRGSSPRYPLDRRLEGPQSLCGRRGDEKSVDPTGTQTPILLWSVPYPIAIPTTLSRFLNI
jgi:hypothetical protein